MNILKIPSRIRGINYSYRINKGSKAFYLSIAKNRTSLFVNRENTNSYILWRCLCQQKVKELNYIGEEDL